MLGSDGTHAVACHYPLTGPHPDHTTPAGPGNPVLLGIPDRQRPKEKTR